MMKSFKKVFLMFSIHLNAVMFEHRVCFPNFFMRYSVYATESNVGAVSNAIG